MFLELHKVIISRRSFSFVISSKKNEICSVWLERRNNCLSSLRNESNIMCSVLWGPPHWNILILDLSQLNNCVSRYDLPQWFEPIINVVCRLALTMSSISALLSTSRPETTWLITWYSISVSNIMNYFLLSNYTINQKLFNMFVGNFSYTQFKFDIFRFM